MSYYTNYPLDIPSTMPEADKALIAQARELPWEQIDEDKAASPEGRSALRQLAVSKYHHAEARRDMI